MQFCVSLYHRLPLLPKTLQSYVSINFVIYNKSRIRISCMKDASFVPIIGLVIETNYLNIKIERDTMRSVQLCDDGI